MKFIWYQERRTQENKLIRRYKIYNFIFFKIKKKVLPVFGENNKIIIGGQELGENEKKLLDKFGKITIDGKNNIVKLSNTDNITGNIRIEGENNFVDLSGSNNLNCGIEIVGNNNKVQMGKFNSKTQIGIIMSRQGENRELIINDSIYFQGVVFFVTGNNRKVHVGKNCMFSSGINIWTSDFHFIYDLDTNKCVNEEQDIIIGDNVWIGQNVHVLKGSIIPSGSVVGVGSIVTKAFTRENCIIAGVPAKIVKENIRWEL